MLVTFDVSDNVTVEFNSKQLLNIELIIPDNRGVVNAIGWLNFLQLVNIDSKPFAPTLEVSKLIA